MSYFRSYFSKNNTILKNSTTNTAKNPNTELYYGTGFSKFIFKVDLDDLQLAIDNGDFVLDDNTKHYLHLTNTIFGDEALLRQENGRGHDRTTSFDLIAFPINEFWDEGVGFDYDKTYDFTSGNETFDQRPSNWKNRTTLDLWTNEGVYTGVPTIISTIHFDNGNEDIHADITEYINNILTGLTSNYGLGIAFHPYYEDIKNPVEQSVAFFTKYTQTFFEPYVETVFNDIITDNRENFTPEKYNDLYLYVTKGSNYYDLDELPLVDILDSSKTIVPGLTDVTTVKVRKGVYKVTFGVSGRLCDGKRFYFDKWKNLSIDGIDIDPILQKFVPKPNSLIYSIGENQTELERYVIQFFGIKLNEKIKRGSKRKVVVTLRSITQQKPVLFDELYYRIFIKEGHTQVEVFDWTRLDKTNENSFIIDTSYFIPREYWLEVKALTHTEEIFYREELKFEIVSEVKKKTNS